jgi:monoamine oxidase
MSRASILRRVHRLTAAASVLDRRGFVLGAGAAALAAAKRAAAGPVSPRTGGGEPRIGIVGGGIAGLVAALTLQQAGRRCVVFEAADRLGGRMHSQPAFWAQGQVSEWCGEFIDTDHMLLRGLARRFGLVLDDVNAAMPPHSVDTNWFLGGYYTDAELAADLVPVQAALAQQQAAVGSHYLWNDHDEAAVRLDRLSAHEWIEAFVPGGHASRLGRYLDLGLVSLNGLDTPRQSALNLVLPFHSDERFHVRGGNQQIPEAVAAALADGTVRTGWRLAVLAQQPGGGVTAGFDTPSGARELAFDRLILALPFTVLRRLDLSQAGFDARKRAMIEAFAYGTNSKLALQFDRRYWNGRGAWPGVGDGFVSTDLPFQGTWDSSRAQAGDDGLLTNYTGGTTGASYRPDGPYTDSRTSAATAGYATAMLAQLEQVWPGISPSWTGAATLSFPTGDPNLGGSYSAFGVGQYTRFAGYGRVPQGRSTSPASTPRCASSATWRAAPNRASGPRAR